MADLKDPWRIIGWFLLAVVVPVALLLASLSLVH